MFILFRVKYNDISNEAKDIRQQLSSPLCIQNKPRKESVILNQKIGLARELYFYIWNS